MLYELWGIRNFSYLPDNKDEGDDDYDEGQNWQTDAKFEFGKTGNGRFWYLRLRFLEV